MVTQLGEFAFAIPFPHTHLHVASRHLTIERLPVENNCSGGLCHEEIPVHIVRFRLKLTPLLLLKSK